MQSNLAVVLFFVLQGLFAGSVSGASNQSYEHKIRAYLLDNYDKTVRPVLGNKSVEVSFAMKISRLVKVNNKEQLVVLDTWVTQTWTNVFLQWNANNYGGFNRVQFLPDEIWVPDTSLFNNGDESVTLAGGRTKFVTEISVSDTGHCVWSGPATFKANCQLEISQWPFDTQTCELGFGSFTYGIDQMNIKLFQDSKGQYTNRFVTNGDWRIDEITTSIETTDHGDCCPFKFSEVVYKIKMGRKPLYHVFYLTIPSLMLMIIGLTSFLIPVESGERIGFVTTILLAMTVFLLLIPSFLPESSDGVPILGVGLQATMIIIALVLFCNIFVLKLFFMEGSPPEWVQNLFRLCCLKKGKTVQRIHVSNTRVRAKSSASANAVELAERSGERINTPTVWEKKVDDLTWQQESIKLDQVFFVLFMLVVVITYVVVYVA